MNTGSDNKTNSIALKVFANNENSDAPVAKIPAWAKPFAEKTPAQFFEIYLPRKKVEALAGLMFAFADMGVDLPEWAKNASMQFWKNYIGSKPLRFTESAEDFGVVVVMIEKFAQGLIESPEATGAFAKLQRFVSGIAKKFYQLVMREIVSKFTHAEKAQFYAGCVRGEQILEKFQTLNLDMVPLAKVYLVISLAWRDIESCKTHAERINWLKKNKVIEKDTNADEVDKYKVSDRALYQAFETIGLPGAAPGKPKTPEN